MAKTITGICKYDHEGKEYSGEFEFTEFSSVQDALATLGEAKTLDLIHKSHKIEKANSARIALQSVNGHSKVVKMSEEAKANAKQKRQATAKLVAALQAKGMTLEEVMEMIGA